MQVKEREYLDFDASSDQVRLSRRSDEHRLLLHVNDKKYEIGRVANAFPLSAGLKRIVFFNQHGEEIGVLKAASGLDDNSLCMLREELDRAYFMPVIEAIYGIGDHLGLELWDVLTNRGRRSFEVRQPRKNVRMISPGRIIIKDVDGNRYEVKGWQKMDKKSISLLMRHL